MLNASHDSCHMYWYKSSVISWLHLSLSLWSMTPDTSDVDNWHIAVVYFVLAAVHFLHAVVAAAVLLNCIAVLSMMCMSLASFHHTSDDTNMQICWLKLERNICTVQYVNIMWYKHPLCLIFLCALAWFVCVYYCMSVSCMCMWCLFVCVCTLHTCLNMCLLQCIEGNVHKWTTFHKYTRTDEECSFHETTDRLRDSAQVLDHAILFPFFWTLWCYTRTCFIIIMPPTSVGRGHYEIMAGVCFLSVCLLRALT